MTSLSLQGVLAVVNTTRRVILQGVYELYETEPTTEWGEETRTSRVVLIGKAPQVAQAL